MYIIWSGACSTARDIFTRFHLKSTLCRQFLGHDSTCPFGRSNLIRLQHNVIVVLWSQDLVLAAIFPQVFTGPTVVNSMRDLEQIRGVGDYSLGFFQTDKDTGDRKGIVALELGGLT